MTTIAENSPFAVEAARVAVRVAASNPVPRLPASLLAKVLTYKQLAASARISQSGRNWGRKNGVFDVIAVVEALDEIDSEACGFRYRLLSEFFGNPFRPSPPSFRRPRLERRHVSVASQRASTRSVGCQRARWTALVWPFCPTPCSTPVATTQT